MLTSPLWNLFYIGATAIMMGYAYYSRGEYIQKLALAVLGIWIVSQFVIHTPMMYVTYAVLDVIGICYAMYLHARQGTPETLRVILLFVAMLALHAYRTDEMPWLQYQIAGNVLYLAQLVTLSTYGKRYGLQARENVNERNDPFYRFIAYARR